MEIGAVTTTGTTTGDARASIGGTFDTFLTLLTTQLQYQDPIDPLNTDEFTNQLVQFTQVEQQIQSNDKLDELLAQGSLNQISFAASLTGKDAEITGSELEFDGQTPLAFGYQMPAGATEATVSILNHRGTVVYTTSADIGEGRHPFTWDGRTSGGPTAAAGAYRIQVAGKDADGNAITAATSVVRRVTGVDLSGRNILIETGDLSFELSDILAIRQPDADV